MLLLDAPTPVVVAGPHPLALDLADERIVEIHIHEGTHESNKEYQS